MEKKIGLKLSDSVVQSFKCSRVFKEAKGDINSIDFSDNGKWLVAGAEDNSISLFDVEVGKKTEMYFNKKYGVNLVTYTHSPKTILCTSKPEVEPRIMYWSLHDNMLLFSFLGHKEEILGLEMNPANDSFVSYSKDGTARVWNIAQRKLIAVFNNAKCAAFDNTGKVLAIVVSAIDLDSTEPRDSLKYYINLYSSTLSKTVPFLTFQLEEGEIKRMKFSNNGEYIMCYTDTGYHILNAFTGESKGIFKPIVSSEAGINNLEGSFSPDSQYFTCGSEDGTIQIWNIKAQEVVCKLEKHFKPVNCLKFSNKYAILVSACQNILFWQPQFSEAEAMLKSDE